MPTQTTSAPTRTVAESPPETESESGNADLPLDVVFDLLSNERRRWTFRYLLAEPDGTTLGDLAEHVASIENDKRVSEVTSRERKRAYVGLYQCHLPKMDDAGVVDFDGDRKTIQAGQSIEQVTRFLPEKEGDGPAGDPGEWTTAVSDFTRAVGGWFLNTVAL